MGCFNVSCGLSHTSIGHNERAGLILLLPNDYSSMSRCIDGNLVISPGSNLISNDGAFTLYRACAFPIWGKYNDYGRLEDIQEDNNTKALETYFGTSIGVIEGTVTIGANHMEEYLKSVPKDKLKILKSLSGMWVSRRIYEPMSKFCRQFTYGEFNEAREMIKKITSIVDKGASADFMDFFYHGMDGKFYNILFWKIYKDSLGTKKNWMDKQNDYFRSVHLMMSTTNRMFMPIKSGPQDGEYDIELELNEIINDRLKKRIKRLNR